VHSGGDGKNGDLDPWSTKGKTVGEKGAPRAGQKKKTQRKKKDKDLKK